MALGIVPDDPDSVTKAFPDLKTELDNEKAAQKVAQIEVDTLAWAVKDLKISVDKFATQIPTLRDKVKYLKNKVVDGLNEVRARELCLECSTWANNDYKNQNAQLTNKLESKSLGRVRTFYQSWTISNWPRFDSQNQMLSLTS
jgi:archaellum component FlaC